MRLNHLSAAMISYFDGIPPWYSKINAVTNIASIYIVIVSCSVWVRVIQFNVVLENLDESEIVYLILS